MGNIQHLGCSNGFNEEQNRIFNELYKRWKLEKEQGKEVKYIKDKGEDDIHIFIDLYKFRKDSDISCIKTISVAEMIEMLPKKINKGNDYYLVIFALKKGYGIQYLSVYNGVMQAGKADTNGILLRDALFEMFKLLKQNKLI